LQRNWLMSALGQKRTLRAHKSETSLAWIEWQLRPKSEIMLLCH
jgi:hypothetical protein